jgi:hypothetical protein
VLEIAEREGFENGVVANVIRFVRGLACFFRTARPGESSMNRPFCTCVGRGQHQFRSREKVFGGVAVFGLCLLWMTYTLGGIEAKFCTERA